MDDERKTPNADASGKSYSLDDILMEYGHTPVHIPDDEDADMKIAEPARTDKPDPPPDRPAPKQEAASTPEISDIAVDFEEEDDELDTPLEEPPAISVSDFDQAYKQQQKEIKQHRKLVLKTRVKNKRYRYIKQVQKIAGEINDELKAREKEEEKQLLNRSVGEYINDYTTLARSLAVRQWFCLLLTIPVVYLGVASQLGLPLPESLIYRNHPYTFLAVQIVLMGGVMLSGLDVFASGIRSLIRFRPDTESLVSLSAFLCFLYNITVVLAPKWGGYISFAPVAAINMSLAVMARRRVFSAKSKALRSAAKIKNPLALTRAEKAYKGQDCIVKAPAQNIDGFVKGLEEKGLSSKLLHVYSGLSVAAVLLVGLTCLMRGEGTRLPFYVSSVAAMLPSCGLILGSALPYSKVSKKLLRDGVAMGGEVGLGRLNAKGALVLTDADFFGAQSVTLQGYKLFGDVSREKAITYTASLLTGAGCGIAYHFKDLAMKEFCTLVEPQSMEYSDYGGIKAVIGKDHVMVGTAAYMYRMGLRPPADIKLRTAVFCAINMELAAVFALRYLPNDTHRHWINLLTATKRKAILASRDFNVTPALIEQRFRIKSGAVEYPEIDTRLNLNSTVRRSNGSHGMLMLHDTLEGYIGAVEGCRRFNKIARVCSFMGLAASLFGAAVAAMLLFGEAYVAVSPLNVTLYALLWAIPTFLLSGWAAKF